MDDLHNLFQRANKASGGLLGILQQAFESFGGARGPQAAAAIAYFAMFSLFPLLLALVAGGSFFLQSQRAFNQAVGLVSDVIPVSQTLIRENVSQVLDKRGSIGLVALISLVWSASGAFTALAGNINLAWPGAEEMGLVEQRLLAFGMVAVVILLFVLSVGATALLSLLPQLDVPLGSGMSIYKTTFWHVLSALVPVLLNLVLFLALYRWVPNTFVPWRAALWGGMFAAVSWELAKRGFAYYLGSGLVRYDLVYGSLGAVVVLMFWVYLSAWIALFGAHLSAAIGRRDVTLKEG
ncbi:MAG: YihY/virulence factor BrkB family protein [Anaerolineae bacterium]|jgi:membrane protein